MNFLDKICIKLYTFWYVKVTGPYQDALIFQALMEYRNSWKFKERWQLMGLDYAENYDLHFWDITYHRKNISKWIKAKLFFDSMILGKSRSQIPFYFLES